MHRLSFCYRGVVMALLAASSLANGCSTPMPSLAAIPPRGRQAASSSKYGQVLRNALPTQQMVDDEAARNRPDRVRQRSSYVPKRLMNRKLIRAISRWQY